MKILILGVGGMLGNTLARFLSRQDNTDVFGTARALPGELNFYFGKNIRILTGVDVTEFNLLFNTIKLLNPDLIVNCIGITKQVTEAKDPSKVISINSLFPHQLSYICDDLKIRLVHISTDCVFSGKKGQYIEEDFCDGDDLYGRSKFLGEVSYSPNVITLRTSIIGHELSSKSGLLEWFLSQLNSANGYSKAIFSGLTTLEISKVIFDYVLPNPNLSGLYHLSSYPIDKYFLLSMVAKYYEKSINIKNDINFVIDRSLDSTKFKNLTGWVSPTWESMIKDMHSEYLSFKNI